MLRSSEWYLLRNWKFSARHWKIFTNFTTRSTKSFFENQWSLTIKKIQITVKLSARLGEEKKAETEQCGFRIAVSKFHVLRTSITRSKRKIHDRSEVEWRDRVTRDSHWRVSPRGVLSDQDPRAGYIHWNNVPPRVPTKVNVFVFSHSIHKEVFYTGRKKKLRMVTRAVRGLAVRVVSRRSHRNVTNAMKIRGRRREKGRERTKKAVGATRGHK